MPLTERIDQYVDRSNFRSDTDFILANLKEVLDAYKKLSGAKVSLSGANTTRDTINNTKALNAELLKTAKLNELAAKSALLEAKARKELALQQKADAQARKESAAAAQKEQQASDAATKAKINEQKVIDQVANEYLQLSKAYNDAALKAKNYALTLGENHPITIEAVKDAKAMHDILLRVDQSVGQSQRNVGNYKSAFDGLGMSFTQIARELPSLTISVQQFLLAISNNLPMVQDEIRKARTEIAQLRAEGKETPSLLQRIGGSIISWNVGLSVGIALLTAYGPKLIEWAKGLLDGTGAAKEAAKRQAEFNETQEKGLEIAKKYDDLRSQNYGTINRNLQNQIAYAKAAGKSEAEILELERELAKERVALAQVEFISTAGLAKLDELGNLLKVARDEYETFLATRQAFGRELKFGSEDYKEREGQLKSSFEYAGKLYERQKAIVEEFYDSHRDLEAKNLEIQRHAAEQRAKFFADELQYRADILKKFSENEDGPSGTRINARKQALALEKQILEGQRKDELIDAKDNQVKIFEINREYAFKRKKLIEEFESDVLAIRQTSIKKQRELESEWNKIFQEEDENRIRQQDEAETKAFERRKHYLEENRDILLRSIEEERNEKLKSAQGDKERQEIEQKYNRKRQQVELETNAAILQSALEVAEAKLKIAQKDTDQNVIADLEAQIASLKEQLEKLKGIKIDWNIQDAKTKLEKLAAVIQEIGNKILSLFTAIGDIFTANIDKEKNAVQEQIDALEEKKQKDIEVVNSSVLTEQEKANKIAIINARSATQKEALERRQRQLDLQRARFDKARAIMQAILNTAVAVLDGLIKGGPILAAIYGAIGAVQIAAAIAAPLPKFRQGRKNGPDTLGIVGDGGRREVIYSPDLSDIMVTPDKDTIAFIPRGYGVAPSVEDFQATAMKMAHKSSVATTVINNNNDGLIRAMAYQIGGLKAAILGKQETHFHWHNGELQKAIQNGNNWLRYKQNNV